MWALSASLDDVAQKVLELLDLRSQDHHFVAAPQVAPPPPPAAAPLVAVHKPLDPYQPSFRCKSCFLPPRQGGVGQEKSDPYAHTTGPAMRCWGCGAPGHKQRDCPRLVGKGRGRGKGNSYLSLGVSYCFPPGTL